MTVTVQAPSEGITQTQIRKAAIARGYAPTAAKRLARRIYTNVVAAELLRALHDPSYILTYADPTGETAVQNVLRELRRQVTQEARALREGRTAADAVRAVIRSNGRSVKLLARSRAITPSARAWEQSNLLWKSVTDAHAATARAANLSALAEVVRRQ